MASHEKLQAHIVAAERQAKSELMTAAFLDIESAVATTTTATATSNATVSPSSPNSSLKQFAAHHKDFEEASQRALEYITANEDALSPLGVASKVLGVIKGVIGEPFASVVGVIGAICGLAARAIANQKAVTNLSQRLLSLHPVLAKLYSDHVQHADISTSIVQRIEEALEKARKLIEQFVPPEEKKCGDGGEEPWIGSTLVSWVKSKVAMISTSTEDFEDVHAAIDRVLHDYNFSALVRIASPSNNELVAMVQADTALLQEVTEKRIKEALAAATDETRSEIRGSQEALQKQFATSMTDLTRKLNTISAVMESLLRTQEFEQLRVPESSVRLSQKIAAGGNAEVFAAEVDGAPVVAKKSKACDKHQAEDILREAKLLMRLRHPNILHCYGVTVKRQETYLLLERCVMTLAEMLQKHGRVPLPEAAIALLKVASGLCQLHNILHVHRDVKALNVMLKENGEVCLIDFGSAKKEISATAMGLTTTSSAPGSNVGIAGTTLLYAAPELLLDSKLRATPKCDVYSFGMLMYELLTAKTPFVDDGDNRPEFLKLADVASGKLSPKIPEDLATSIDPSLLRLMKACWAPDPEDRPMMEVVRGDLNMFLQSKCESNTVSSIWRSYLKRIGVLEGGEGGVSRKDEDTSAGTLPPPPPPRTEPLAVQRTKPDKSSSSKEEEDEVGPSFSSPLHNAILLYRKNYAKGKSSLNDALALMHQLGHSDITARELRLLIRASPAKDKTALSEQDFASFLSAWLKSLFDDHVASTSNGELDLPATQSLLRGLFSSSSASASDASSQQQQQQQQHSPPPSSTSSSLPQITDAEASKLFKLADRDKNGTLSFAEFLVLVDTLHEDVAAASDDNDKDDAAAVTATVPARGTVDEHDHDPKNATTTTLIRSDKEEEAEEKEKTKRDDMAPPLVLSLDDMCATCRKRTMSVPILLRPGRCAKCMECLIALQRGLDVEDIDAIVASTTPTQQATSAVAMEVPFDKEQLMRLVQHGKDNKNQNVVDLMRHMFVIGGVPSKKDFDLLKECGVTLVSLVLTLGAHTNDDEGDVKKAPASSSPSSSAVDAPTSTPASIEVQLSAMIAALPVTVTSLVIGKVPSDAALDGFILSSSSSSASRTVAVVKQLHTLAFVDGAFGDAALVQILQAAAVVVPDHSSTTEGSSTQHQQQQRLERLYLTGCRQLTDKSLVPIKNLSSLVFLDMAECLFTDSGFAHVRSLSHLEVLNADYCDNITDAGLAHLWALKELRTLSFGGCEQFTDGAMEHISALSSIQVLNLDYCSQLTDVGLGQLGSGLTELRSLDLSYCDQIGKAGFQSLLTLTHLETLTLKSCEQLTDDDLEPIGQMQSLRHLSLRYCTMITDEGFAHLRGLRNIQTLILGGCKQLTDASLAVIKSFANLQTLNISYCTRMTNGGLSNLRSLEQLRMLNIGYCKEITPVGLEHLKHNQKLKVIKQ